MQFLELLMPPVLKQAGGLRRHLPLVRVPQVAQSFALTADFVEASVRRLALGMRHTMS